jgi:hypothetical protein
MATATLQAIAAQLGPQLLPLQLHLWRQGECLHLRCRGNPLPEPQAVEAHLDLEQLVETLPPLFAPGPVPRRLIVYGCQPNELKPRWQTQYIISQSATPTATEAAIALSLSLACADLPVCFQVRSHGQQLQVDVEGRDVWQPADLLPLLEPVLEECAAQSWQDLSLTWTQARQLIWQVDIPLSPLEERLQTWARWGEAEAIARWLEHQNAGWRFQRQPQRDASIQLVAQPQGDRPLASQRLRRQLRQLGAAGVTRTTVVLPQDEMEVRLRSVLPSLRSLPRLQSDGAKAALLSRLWSPDLDRRLSLLCPRLRLTQRGSRLDLVVESLWPLSPAEVVAELQAALEAARWPNLQAVRVCLRSRGEPETRWCQLLTLPPLLNVHSRVARPSSRPGALGRALVPSQRQRSQVAVNLTLLLLSAGAIALIDRSLGAFLASQPRDSRHPSLTTGNNLLDRKLQQTEHRPADVVIVGSSRALRGLNPSLLQQVVSPQGQPPLRIYNFGLNGATAQVVEALGRHWILPNQRPRLLLWLDGARAFNSGRPDQTFQAMASSKAFQHWLQPTNQSSDPSPPIWMRWSAVYPQRQWLLQKLKAPFRPPVTAQGTEAGPLQADGFVPVTRTWTPLKTDPSQPLVQGEHDRDYTNFRFVGEQSQALDRLLHLTQQQQVSVVFVNAPLTRDYLDAPRQKAEAHFRAWMQTQDRAGRLRFLDYSQVWGDRPEYFSDPSHLNRTGAAALTRALAKDARITWPQPRP